MSIEDQEFVQILNIIRRGQRLVIQAKKEGAEIKLAEEFINEAKYALKLNKREEAIEYAKQCIFEVIKVKKEMDVKKLSQEGELEKLTKDQLRSKCIELGLEPLGLKTELLRRIKAHLEKLEKEGHVVEQPPKARTDPPKEKGDLRKVSDILAGKEKDGEDEIKERPAPPKPIKTSAAKSGEWSAEKAAFELTPGLSYLVEEKRPDRVFMVYKALTNIGDPGLAISRTNPKILSRSYGLNEDTAIWLTGKEIHGEIRSVLPILEFIMSLIEEHMTANQKSVILLDGLEYLLTNNKFNSVLRFLRQLVDNISQTDSILLVALSPEALDSTEVTLLEKDLQPIVYLE
ncbi:MAG: DUF835 domain-containing protein [Candidatus Thermoplasmatota archaeon]|jgi:hypothetical protein|nr:DUF835 domain-containing protein [Candidatus Thermoplasmatota archaeon]